MSKGWSVGGRAHLGDGPRLLACPVRLPLGDLARLAHMRSRFAQHVEDMVIPLRRGRAHSISGVSTLMCYAEREIPSRVSGRG